MKRIFLTLTIAFTMPLTKQIPANTYESIRQEIEDEANQTIKKISEDYKEVYEPTQGKLFVSSCVTCFLIPLIIQCLKDDYTGLACIYSGVAGLTGYFTILQHSLLMSYKDICNQRIIDADRVYNKKLAHIHTRHYLGDIAKFQMARVEEIAKEYLAPQNALPKDKNQE